MNPCETSITFGRQSFQSLGVIVVHLQIVAKVVKTFGYYELTPKTETLDEFRYGFATVSLRFLLHVQLIADSK